MSGFIAECAQDAADLFGINSENAQRLKDYYDYNLSFFAPFRSKTNIAVAALLPIAAPIAFGVLAAASAAIALTSTLLCAASLFYLNPHDDKSARTIGMFGVIAVASALLTPLLAAGVYLSALAAFVTFGARCQVSCEATATPPVHGS